MRVGKWYIAGFLAAITVASFSMMVPAAVTQLAGLAVAQSGTAWTNLRDVSVGDSITAGAAYMVLCLWTGTDCIRARGDLSNGLDVDVTRLGGTAADNSPNSTAKLPVLPCVASQPNTFQSWTPGNQVPCTVNVNGTAFVQQRGILESAQAAVTTYPAQALNLFNSQTTGAANTAVTVTIAAASNQRAMLSSIEAQCSAGSATMTVQDGATTIFTSMGSNVPAAPATYRREWPVPLTGSTNTTMTITLSACGAGNTGTLHVQASRV